MINTINTCESILKKHVTHEYFPDRLECQHSEVKLNWTMDMLLLKIKKNWRLSILQTYVADVSKNTELYLLLYNILPLVYANTRWTLFYRYPMHLANTWWTLFYRYPMHHTNTWSTLFYRYPMHLANTWWTLFYRYPWSLQMRTLPDALCKCVVYLFFSMLTPKHPNGYVNTHLV